MEFLIAYFLSQAITFTDLAEDPINTAWQGRTAARQFECERISQAEGHQRFPGQVPAPAARAATITKIDALVCKRRIVADGARSPRDEVILGRLSEDVGEIAGLIASQGNEKTKWVVDAYYPDPVMVRKIGGAARVSLAERGLRVSNLGPIWTAGDVEVFRSLPMRDAIPLACRRGFATGSFDEDTIFVAIALLHEKESQLHAGTCQAGAFKWLR